jgi:exonuclease SbcC
VAEHFDQIFVVTHIPIDESIFDEIYYVENGKITKVQENTTQSLDYEDIS